MLEKLSVKKPLTVLVGVILIIILGTVSFLNTPTDLLPDIDLPVAAVITTNPGATPEQIEREISIPMEGAMSTLSGINSVSSISNEHVSIMILQFSESVNMDSASLEIREALDMVNLPEGVARPMTLRMSPDMMPIMSGSIHVDGMTIHELTELANNKLAPSIESVPGVAMVNLTGTVQNQLNVILRHEYLDAVNESLSEAVEAMVENAMDNMDALVAEQVENAANMRLAELIDGGMNQDAAAAQLQLEMPAITSRVTSEITANMGSGEDSDGQSEVALPAEMVSLDAINGLLTAQNFSMPAGATVMDDVDFMVRVGDEFTQLDEIKNMLIFDPSAMGLDMEPIRLSDVAEVFISDDSLLSFSRVNGNPNISLSIQRQSGFSVSDVTTDIRNSMDQLESEFEGLEFIVLMDQGEMIGEVIDSMVSNLISGGILAIFVLLLFLKDFRPTIMVAIAIPVSLMLAFTLMYFTGVSLNMISMGGLALAVGMLVDNSIVVIENIYRVRTTTDLSPAKAALVGAKQVSGLILASTLSTIAVFFPIVFTGGITRQLFQDLALTIAYSLLASVLIAITVIPAASSKMLKKVKHDNEGKWFKKLVSGYAKALVWTLKYKWAVLIFSVSALVASVGLIGGQGMEMFPDADSTQISVNVEMPNYMEFDDVVVIAEELSERVTEIQDVATVGVSIGGGGMMNMFDMGGSSSNNISMYVILDSNRTITNAEAVAEINEIGTSMDLEYFSASGDDAGMGMMMGNPISVRIEGLELDAIRETAIRLSDLIREIDGALNVTDLDYDGSPEIRVTVDHDVAMANGLTVAQVFMAVNQAITQPERTMNLHFEGRNYDIIITDGDFISAGIDELLDLELVTQNGMIELSEVATVEEGIGFTSINRMNGVRHVNITGEIADGFNTGLINDEINLILEDFELAPGTSIAIGGEAEMMGDAFGDMVLMLALAMVFIYLIMVAQFQSLLAPFIIMFSIPLAFTGAFLALLVAGMPMSIVAMIGLVLLTGVIVNNGIVLLGFVKQLRWDGMSKKEAIVEAGRQRLRPVLMTALTTIVSMSFIALGVGEGTEMMQPMAVVTIGGLIYGDLMTLFVVPALYDVFNKDKDITQENFDDLEYNS